MDTKSIEKASKVLDGVIVKTPLIRNYNLSEKYGANIFLKREDMQTVRSFKIRGAYYKIVTTNKNKLANGVVCASAGNHAQGVAYACSELKVSGVIYMPTTTPKQKIAKVRHFGGPHIEIKLIGDTYDDAQKEALAFAEVNNKTFIHPFDDEDVITGQGTIGLEIINQIDRELDYILIAIGGGGLLSGVGTYIKSKSPKTKIIGVEAEGAPAMSKSIELGHRQFLPNIDSFADGIAVKMVGERTYPLCKDLLDKIILVPEGKICSSILSLYNDEAIVVEPAGAICFSALDYIKEEIKGKNVVIIVCGGNNDITRTEDIRERALLWEGRKHYFIIRFPQRAGALKEFLFVLGPKDDISHFEYTKKNNRDTGPALVGIELNDPNDFERLISRMQSAGIQYEHLNNNPLLFQMLV